MPLTSNNLIKPYIASHRGCSGGDIIENTVPAFEAALRSGADILEMDVFRTVDNKLYVFHDGMEQRLFWNSRSVLEMTSDEVRALRFMNQNSLPTREGPPALDDVLEQFKHRCPINLDRCWWCWDSVFPSILRHGMEEQILLKSPPKEEYLLQLATQRTPFLYIPIIRSMEEVERVEHSGVDVTALEIIFSDEASPLVHDDFMSFQHNKGRMLWANAITLNFERTLSSWHDDDQSVCGNHASGWQWLIDKRFDIIQTDWPWLLRDLVSQQPILFTSSKK